MRSSWHQCLLLILSTIDLNGSSDHLVSSFGLSSVPHKKLQQASFITRRTRIHSSFYGKFESDEDDDEEDDDEDLDEFQDLDVDSFRSKMDSMFGGEDDNSDSDNSSSDSLSSVDDLIRLAVGGKDPEKPWARPAELEAGSVVIASPEAFCDGFGSFGSKPDSRLLSRFGFGFPPPANLGPDRRADLLPVFIIVEMTSAMIKCVLLNRRTGYLLGDLEETSGQPMLEKFCIQPLWFGGIDSSTSGGIEMLHLCPSVEGSSRLTEEGLFWGGDPNQAQEAMEESTDRVYSGFDFKFFVQSTQFKPKELQKLVDSKSVFLASVSPSLLFQSRDRMGTRRAKPLWTEIMELLGGKYEAMKEQLYADS